jgi:hypothetical protein
LKFKVKHFGALLALFVTIIIVSTSAVVLADEYIVCPPDHEYTGGNSNNVYPLGYATSWRYQQLYLPQVLSGKSGTITNMYFRTDESFCTYTQYTQPATMYNIEIYMGNTPLNYPSSSFASNIANCYDWTLVYQAPQVTIYPTFGKMDWFPVGDLWDVFTLDGSNSLLLEIRFTSRTAPVSWGPIMDAESGVGMYRIYSQSYTATSGSLGSNYGLVTKFDLASGIPADVRMEPQSLNLDSNGNYVQFKVENFPDNPEYTPMDVDETSVAVLGVGADLKFATFNDNKYIGKADRLLVEDAIGSPNQETEIQITGQLKDGTGFKGIAVIKTI